ncbi:MAG: hypothetical protein II663_08875 [Bacteroidales bacterium]|nr:hypothetical protein [Bacteroidales bacterium]
MIDGWIKIHRQILEWRWYSDINVTRLFLHLLLKANFDAKDWQDMTIERGQLVTSIGRLAEQTSLSIKEVRTALKKLESTGEIITKGANKFTTITICKYDTYQCLEDEQGQTKGKQRANEGQTKGKQRATIKESKELNNSTNKEVVIIDSSCEFSQPTDQQEKEPPKTLEERQREFYDEVAQYVGKYDREMLRAFYDYWSEPTQNKKNPKMRKDTERTWATGGRLATWYRRQNETQNNVNTLNSNNYAKNRLKEPHVGQFTDEQFDAICEMGRIITEQNAINKE